MKNIFNRVAQNPAFKLANEWRDTLYYGGVASAVLMASPSFKFAMCATAVSMFTREFSRSLFWYNDINTASLDKLRFVGSQKKEINKVDMYGSALIGASVLPMGCLLLSDMPYSFTFALASLAVLGIISKRPINKALNDYDVILFDYPRKNPDDGGTTQTQKLIDGAKNYFTSRQLSPAPSMG